MDTAKIFINGRSQAVRLPKAYRLSGDEVFVTKIGEAILLLPKMENWDLLIDSLDKFSADFLENISQPYLENRGDIF